MIKQKIEEIDILIAYFSYILNMMKEEIGSENISFMQVGTGLIYAPTTNSYLKGFDSSLHNFKCLIS